FRLINQCKKQLAQHIRKKQPGCYILDEDAPHPTKTHFAHKHTAFCTEILTRNDIAPEKPKLYVFDSSTRASRASTQLAHHKHTRPAKIFGHRAISSYLIHHL
ncbi:3524_t:CDS:1, partial [Diversispora eburnea]